MRIAVLGNEGSWYYRDLERAAAALGHQTVRMDFPRITARVGRAEESLSCRSEELSSFDVVIVRTMPPGSLEQVVYRMDALAALEAAGVVVVNPPKAIECAVDKYLTTHRLAHAGLPVPFTVVCEDSATAMEAFQQMGGDVVVKPLFGSEGRGIVRVHDPDLAWRTFRTLERLNAVLYLQQFIDHQGWDVRVLVLEGEVLGGMRRRGNQDFRTNVSRQGIAERYAPTAQECQWALTAAQAVGAWFAGVDVLYHRDGTGYVIEVNAVPGWRAFARVTGVDVANHLIRKIELFKASGGRQPPGYLDPKSAFSNQSNQGADAPNRH